MNARLSCFPCIPCWHPLHFLLVHMDLRQQLRKHDARQGQAEPRASWFDFQAPRSPPDRNGAVVRQPQRITLLLGMYLWCVSCHVRRQATAVQLYISIGVRYLRGWRSEQRLLNPLQCRACVFMDISEHHHDEQFLMLMFSVKRRHSA